MKAHVILDDALVARALERTGPIKKSELLNIALVALIERQAAFELAKLGGKYPNLHMVPRRRVLASDPD